MTVAKTLTTQTSRRLVETQYGRLRGVLVTLSSTHFPLSRTGDSQKEAREDSDLPGGGAASSLQSRQVEVFYGLQYASVLGGELRFMPPTGPMEKV